MKLKKCSAAKETIMSDKSHAVNMRFRTHSSDASAVVATLGR